MLETQRQQKKKILCSCIKSKSSVFEYMMERFKWLSSNREYLSFTRLFLYTSLPFECSYCYIILCYCNNWPLGGDIHSAKLALQRTANWECGTVPVLIMQALVFKAGGLSIGLTAAGNASAVTCLLLLICFLFSTFMRIHCRKSILLL